MQSCQPTEDTEPMLQMEKRQSVIIFLQFELAVLKTAVNTFKDHLLWEMLQQTGNQENATQEGWLK